MLFDTEVEDEGIFVVSTSGEKHKVNYRDIPSGSRMKFNMPDVFPGGTEVFFEICTHLGTKTLRKYRTRTGVTVA